MKSVSGAFELKTFRHQRWKPRVTDVKLHRGVSSVPTAVCLPLNFSPLQCVSNVRHRYFSPQCLLTGGATFSLTASPIPNQENSSARKWLKPFNMGDVRSR